MGALLALSMLCLPNFKLPGYLLAHFGCHLEDPRSHSGGQFSLPLLWSKVGARIGCLLDHFQPDLVALLELLTTCLFSGRHDSSCINHADVLKQSGLLLEVPIRDSTFTKTCQCRDIELLIHKLLILSSTMVGGVVAARMSGRH